MNDRNCSRTKMVHFRPSHAVLFGCERVASSAKTWSSSYLHRARVGLNFENAKPQTFFLPLSHMPWPDWMMQTYSSLLRHRPGSAAPIHLSRVCPGWVNRKHAAAVRSVQRRPGQAIHAPDFAGHAVPAREGDNPQRHQRRQRSRH